MTKFKASSIKESLYYAIRGLKLAVSSQRNFRIELIIAFVTVVLAVFLKFSVSDLCIVLIMIMLVLICELLNSVVEFILDAVYKNSYSKLVEMAKDISAGMVLLVSFFSVVVGILIFSSYIIRFFI